MKPLHYFFAASLVAITLAACAPPETGTPPTLTAEEEQAIMNEVNAVGTQEEAEGN